MAWTNVSYDTRLSEDIVIPLRSRLGNQSLISKLLGQRKTNMSQSQDKLTHKTHCPLGEDNKNRVEL